MALTKGDSSTESTAKTVDDGGSTAGKATARAGKYDVSIYRAWCKQCGLCVAFCPKKVLTSDMFGNPQVSNPQECIGCRQCVLHCPDFAVNVTDKDDAGEGEA